MDDPDTRKLPNALTDGDPRDEPQRDVGIIGEALLPMLISVVVLSTIGVFVAAIAIN